MPKQTTGEDKFLEYEAVRAWLIRQEDPHLHHKP
jgi:hypothetical protein